MDKLDWFNPRGYLHFDVPVRAEYAAALCPAGVAAHVWSPLIHYVKVEKRYKAVDKKTIKKERPIMYASHRDACILSKYSADLVRRLDKWYLENGLSDSVIAYRALGRSNYHFAKRVEDYVRANSSLTVICFDVTGFFDNLNHKYLKSRLKWILNNDSLDRDWYAVFNSVTRYRYVNLDDIKKHENLAKRLKEKKHHPLANIQKIKDLGIVIHKNSCDVGIPQGTPISATLSNLYMTAFDKEIHEEACKRGALYQRYSDDILIACERDCAQYFRDLVEEKLGELKLELQESKTETVDLPEGSSLTFQYLGYQLGRFDAYLRNKSLSRQWRTVRRAIKKTERVGLRAIKAGKSEKIYTRKLYQRFTDVGSRNFLAYAERSAETLDSTLIRKQAKKLKRFVRGELARIRRK